jgi:DNA-binding HxlR family transcriptional regulator
MSKAKLEQGSKFRSNCPIAKTLDLLGDKWTLLILRDVLIFNAKTYTHFAQSPERIPTNLLSQRLKKLVDEGLLEKSAYQDNPLRYEYLPTEKCKTVRPIIAAMKKFGDVNF